MLIVISRELTRKSVDKCFTVVFNLDNCEGLSVFDCAVCVLINSRNEWIATCKSHEEALALIYDIVEAMRSGATVYDCNERR